jgi:hypothetical protein
VRTHRFANVAALIVALGVVAPLAQAAPAGAVPIFSAPDTIPSCSTSATSDATDELNDWLANTVTNNSIAQLDANKCYRTDGIVQLAAKTNVTLAGNNATLKSYNDVNMGRDNDHLRIRGNLNVIVKNLHIVGTHNTDGYDPTLEAQHAFYLLGNNGVLIDNVTADHVWGDYVALQEVNDHTPTSITVQNSDFGLASTGETGAGRQEFSISDGDGVTVTNNYFGHGSRGAVDIEPTSSGALIRNVTFNSNTFGPNHLMWFANHGANATMTDIEFSDNTLHRTMGIDSVVPDISTVNITNPASFKRSDYRFLRNTSDVTASTGNCPDTTHSDRTMRFWGVKDVVIDWNTQHFAASNCQYLVRAHVVLNGKVTNNRLKNAAYVGWYTGSVMCEKLNYIGYPLYEAPLSAGATQCL